MDHYTVSYEFPDDVKLSYSHCIYAAKGVSGGQQLAMGNKTAMDLTTGTLYKDEREIPNKFESLPNATARAIASFVDCVRNDKEPWSNVDAGRNATLMSILGRTAIYEKRVAEWTEVSF
jgi:hypothetical protein